MPSPSTGPRAAGQSRRIRLHGHEVSYRILGEGPPLLLLHGITSSSESWSDVLPGLAERHTVIAPDLRGHGESAKPMGDYSLGAYASGVRDLMIALGHEHATVVGHSLGGGIAMQFSYQFPERTERLVLVSSGGLGREVHLMLRAATLLNQRLKNIREQGKVMGTERLVIMAALNMANELAKIASREERATSELGSRVRGMRERVERALVHGQQLEL